jgi:hypothetical protein
MRSFLTFSFRQVNYSDQVKEDKMGKACNTLGKNRNGYWISVGNPEGKRLLGDLIRRWKDNIKVDLREI